MATTARAGPRTKPGVVDSTWVSDMDGRDQLLEPSAAQPRVHISKELELRAELKFKLRH